MRADLLPYWRLLAAGFAQQSSYRAAALGGLVANITFGLLKAAVLFATVEAAGGELNGYDLGSVSAYIWLSQGLLGSVNLYGGSAMAERIKNGDVAVDFLRPVSIQVSAVLTEVGKALFALLQRGVPSVLVGLLFVGMTMPTTPLPYLLGMISLLVGITMSAGTAFLVATAGFWFIETRGLQVLYMVLSGFLAGLFVPVGLFPDPLRLIAQLTPFPAMLQYPVDVLSGRAQGVEALGLVGIQVLWLVAVGLAGHWLTVAGRARLEVQGG